MLLLLLPSIHRTGAIWHSMWTVQVIQQSQQKGASHSAWSPPEQEHCALQRPEEGARASKEEVACRSISSSTSTASFVTTGTGLAVIMANLLQPPIACRQGSQAL
jgi:hypothetical protein